MNNHSVIKGLYTIVDNSFPDPVTTAKKVLAGGCRLLQLRAKGLPAQEFLRKAIAIREYSEMAGATFIVNDSVDVAMLAGADGVHLGQDDLHLEDARRVMGEGKIIGISTHCLDEALAAEYGGADYIGFGPVYGTSTKKDAHSIRGLDALSEITERISVPVVAIGGIDEKNMRRIYERGAAAAAVISAIATAENITGMTSRLVGTRSDS